jgi:hypothetical protein
MKYFGLSIISALIAVLLVWDMIILEWWIQRVEVGGAVSGVNQHSYIPTGFVYRRKYGINTTSIGTPIFQYFEFDLDCEASTCSVTSSVNGVVTHRHNQSVPSAITEDGRTLKLDQNDQKTVVSTTGISVIPGDEYQLEFRVTDSRGNTEVGTVTVTYWRWFKVRSRFVGRYYN